MILHRKCEKNQKQIEEEVVRLEKQIIEMRRETEKQVYYRNRALLAFAMCLVAQRKEDLRSLIRKLENPDHLDAKPMDLSDDWDAARFLYNYFDNDVTKTNNDIFIRPGLIDIVIRNLRSIQSSLPE